MLTHTTTPGPASSLPLAISTLLLTILLALQWGSAVAATAPEPKQPAEVWIGLKVNQITQINQKAENFTIVGTMHMRWLMEELAFEPAIGDSGYRTYKVENFTSMLSERNIRWPEISFFNQQGRSHIQNSIIHLDRDGSIHYFERFTATFQAPTFDFTHFPLDTQQFYVQIDSVFPVNEFVFRELPGESGMGKLLGEEEWVVTEVETNITRQHEKLNLEGSRFTLTFTAHRHLNYYLLRILTPSLLIILVTWITFFLRDYSKRIDLASANLLMFIAFNFTISDDLPRLGYLTIMDAYLAGMFVITSLVVLVNVLFRRMQNSGREALVKRLDVYAISSYPLAYLALFAGIYYGLR